MIKRGFTLAEVLITLGIIGIVAALTIPTLMYQNNKNVEVTQLKKFYSVFNQGMKGYMTKSGCEDLACTNLFDQSSSNGTWQTNMVAAMKETFAISKSCYSNDTTCKRIIPELGGSSDRWV